MKPLLQNVILALLGIGLALGCAELVARWLPPPLDGSSNPADVCSHVTGWRGKPYYQTTVATEDYIHDLTLNSRGMHDTDHSFDNPDDRYRILMLGDSFVQAVQVREAETAHQVLESLLNEQVTQTVELISAGVGGWGTGQQLMYYRTEGHLYQPDLLLLMVYMGNDVKDNLPGRGVTVEGYNCYAPFFVHDANQLDPQRWLFAPGIKPPTDATSAVWKAWYNSVGHLYQRSRLYGQLEPLLSKPPLQASVLDFYRDDTPLFDYGLHLTTALVQQLMHEARQDGVEVGLVLIAPLNLLQFSKASPAEREAIYQRLPFMRRFESLPSPNITLAQTFAADGTPVLDLYPAFMAQTNQTGENLFFKQDKHWNAAGNQLAAQTIAAWVAGEYLTK